MPHPSKINSHVGLVFILGILCVIGVAIAFVIFGDASRAAPAEDDNNALEQPPESASEG